ncbi:hypothetical protein [Paenibacillus glucanolyticus]|uniref:hypothetical protein n=1 Tax=Paenibacillus glucanolyticus TaxID=59843 RepID=UPI0015C37353|nr:hypothetical protein [Paenibacillus glucanolyticus]
MEETNECYCPPSKCTHGNYSKCKKCGRYELNVVLFEEEPMGLCPNCVLKKILEG